MKKEDLIIGRKYKITKPEKLTPLVGCHWADMYMDDLDGRTFTLTQKVYDNHYNKYDGWDGLGELPELNTTWSVCLSWLTLVENEKEQPQEHNHYFKNCPYDKVDIYRIIELFDITDPCLQHAFKKIACTGKRGHKDIHKDVQDIIDTLNRWKEMRGEEADV